MSDSNNSDEKEKHSNVGAACFRCRGFRHACDRKRPACSRCHRRGISCVYPEAAPTLKKLQKATENLGDRIKKFNERLKTNELNQSLDDYICSPYAESMDSTVYSDDEVFPDEPTPKRRMRRGKVASTTSFSVYPCTKCFKDLQQCDLTFPKCTRCSASNSECVYKKTEPKANHVSQVLTTMNRVMDQWQDSIDRMARDFAQKTRELSAKANTSLKNQAAFKITTTKKGISVESNVNSYNDLSTLVDQFKRSMSISSNGDSIINSHTNNINSTFSSLFQRPSNEFDDAYSTSSGLAIWGLWAHSTHAMPKDYPIDITDELTDSLIKLYCRTPCCSSIRIPIINTTEFLSRYHDPDPTKRPSKVLIYAICAMAARNAFQLHIWSKRPLSDVPQYNMGKALSVAYGLRGRELLSECFDEPSFDHCQAAFLLSYCNYQNGYPGVIYFYEWIAYTMAEELGLYNANRELNKEETMLIWCIYYFNVWYRTLQGVDSTNTNSLPQCKPPIETIPKAMAAPTNEEEKVEFYVWNTWVYMIQLQVMRDQTLSVLSKQFLPEELFEMQKELSDFHDNLPKEWKNTDTTSEETTDTVESPDSSTTCCSEHSNEQFKTDINSFSKYCVQLVQIQYCINQILLYEPFVPMYDPPSIDGPAQSLETILQAANHITDLIEKMIQKRENCSIPVVSFLFVNVVYKKIMSYHGHFQETGKLGLLRTLDISKSSITYVYDFELARSLVNIMESDIQSSVQNTLVCTPSPSSAFNYTEISQPS